LALLALLAALVAVASRAAMARAAAASGKVDHYYWMLAAEAYRSQRGLPVRLRGKYLMEPDEQAYPPLFGLLLGRWGLDRHGMAAVVALEIIQMAAVAAVMTTFHAPLASIALGIGLYATAPVRVTYNTQLNSRILGDVFLFSLLAAEACAAFAVHSPTAQVALWTASALMTAVVVMSHKMTVQLYLALLPFWSWAIGDAMPIAVLLAGFVIYVFIVGPRFAVYQARAHWDIIKFWNRHWPRLGAHQFRDSPIYGAPEGGCSTCFHQPGVRGIARHLRLVASYAPVNLLLPVASLATASWPPTWLLVWLGGVYVWALATLLVPQLRCLGGGHLYVFNAVAPGACYAAWLPDTMVTATWLGAGLLLTVASLLAAWRIVRSRPAARDEMFDRALSALAAEPRGRVAVFPLQNAEAVAWGTHHAVLWGAHGYGFSQLEGFFPVLTKPLSAFLREYRIGWILSDERFWRGGVERLRREGVETGRETEFGPWRLTECRAPSADRLEVSRA
jgi:hypothetical protein